MITNRTTGRTVTDREEVLEDMRRQLALERTEEYLNDLRSLGFDRAEAAEMIRGEGENNGD